MATERKQALGYYRCFCSKVQKEKLKNPEYLELCEMFVADKQTALFLTNVVTFLVSAINYFLKNINIGLVKDIGIEREGKQDSMIMNFIFASTFFNTAIILLLVNSNLQYSPISFIPIYNIYAEITADWYVDIGITMTQSMIIIAGMPIAFLMGFYMMKVTYRFLDAGFYCCKKEITTKKVSQKQYKDLWSGVPYVMFA